LHCSGKSSLAQSAKSNNRDDLRFLLRQVVALGQQLDELLIPFAINANELCGFGVQSSEARIDGGHDIGLGDGFGNSSIIDPLPVTPGCYLLDLHFDIFDGVGNIMATIGFLELAAHFLEKPPESSRAGDGLTALDVYMEVVDDILHVVGQLPDIASPKFGLGTELGITSQKMDINTGSRGPFVPEIKPVQKIRDKSPPPPPLWYRFLTN
jgi:hypothetical protein